MNYLWYHIVEGENAILQGDFINSCPLVIPTTDITSKTVGGKIIEYDVIVMSQSCDLLAKKVDLVLVCPLWSLKEFEIKNEFFRSKKGKEELRRGHLPGYHLLNKCDIEGFERDYIIVDFRNVYSVPFNFLLDMPVSKEKRLRLLPPYREHLSQAFARFFMRVGLPVDIPSFK